MKTIRRFLFEKGFIAYEFEDVRKEYNLTGHQIVVFRITNGSNRLWVGFSEDDAEAVQRLANDFRMVADFLTALKESKDD